jgi:hypothetical protein
MELYLPEKISESIGTFGDVAWMGLVVGAWWCDGSQ